MKTFLKRILIAVGLTLGANAMLGATLANDWAEQYFKAKVGRYTRGEESRLRELDADTAFREETPEGFVAPTWAEQLFKAKTGRDVPGK